MEDGMMTGRIVSHLVVHAPICRFVNDGRDQVDDVVETIDDREYRKG